MSARDMAALGKGDDPRLRPALAWLEERRNRDGTWNLDAIHPDLEDEGYLRGMQTPTVSVGLEFPGRPSRWITRTPLTVLRRAGRPSKMITLRALTVLSRVETRGVVVRERDD
jgi:hypothetical protein